jgi:prepilin-type N-terminal cleavage/methylation domain-containing protein
MIRNAKEVRPIVNRKHRYNSPRGDGGFTLLELMIVVAVVSVLATIAVPSYNNYVTKTNRSVAKAKLIDASSRMEMYFLNNKTYNTTDMRKLGYTADPLAINNEGVSVGADVGIYQVDVKTANAAS